MDTICVLPRLPQPNDKLRLSDVRWEPGGQVATALVACARLGLSTRYIGSVGDDFWGRQQLDSLASEKVGIEHCRSVANTSTQIGVILLEEGVGERTVLWKRDSRLQFPVELLRRDAIQTARFFHTDGADGKACLQAAQWARDAGIPVVIDIDEIYDDVTEDLLRLVDYLIAPETFGDPESLHRRYGCPVVGITRGSHGSVFLAGGKILEHPAFKVETRDTTGAGDAFHGGFIYGLSRQWPLDQTIRFAHAVAALKCRAVGARTGIPSLAEALDFISSASTHRLG